MEDGRILPGHCVIRYKYDRSGKILDEIDKLRG